MEDIFVINARTGIMNKRRKLHINTTLRFAIIVGIDTTINNKEIKRKRKQQQSQR